MSTNNICFHGEIRNIFTGYSPLSRPMYIDALLKVRMLVFYGHTWRKPEYLRETMDHGWVTTVAPPFRVVIRCFMGTEEISIFLHTHAYGIDKSQGFLSVANRPISVPIWDKHCYIQDSSQLTLTSRYSQILLDDVRLLCLRH